MQALFTLAYSVRFGAKKELELDYPVMASEGLYQWLDYAAPLEPGSWEPDEGPGELRCRPLESFTNRGKEATCP